MSSSLLIFLRAEGVISPVFSNGIFPIFFATVLSQVDPSSLSRLQGQLLNFCGTSKSFLCNPQTSKTNRKRGTNQRITSCIQEKAKERHNRMKKKGLNSETCKISLF